MNSLAEHDDSDTLPDPWQHGMDDICDNDETSVPPTSSSTGNAAYAANRANEPALCAWIALIVNRDEAALGNLYEVMIGRVYGLALRITRNAQTAEEVAEDTFWQIWRQAPRFDPARGTAVAWMLTIARSRALDALRRRRERHVGRNERVILHNALTMRAKANLIWQMAPKTCWLRLKSATNCIQHSPGLIPCHVSLLHWHFSVD